ncbi:hypothetical protein [Actinokineospora enzanensis]|uniref:hypothetical protein n=1 Tax=Actinokineospora enzanensis TaxID=155975 RepID=UPI00036AD9AD|nr:hypothetical protein [Actinokineospora enzanensis]
MSAYIVHTGRRKWWDGRVITLCGLVIPKMEAERCWFSAPTCPTCKELKKRGVRP